MRTLFQRNSEMPQMRAPTADHQHNTKRLTLCPIATYTPPPSHLPPSSAVEQTPQKSHFRHKKSHFSRTLIAHTHPKDRAPATFSPAEPTSPQPTARAQIPSRTRSYPARTRIPSRTHYCRNPFLIPRATRRTDPARYQTERQFLHAAGKSSRTSATGSLRGPSRSSAHLQAPNPSRSVRMHP
jgi:hypothetical protein